MNALEYQTVLFNSNLPTFFSSPSIYEYSWRW